MDAIRSGYYICHTIDVSLDDFPDVCSRCIQDLEDTMAIYTLKSADRSYSIREKDFIAFLRNAL